MTPIPKWMRVTVMPIRRVVRRGTESESWLVRAATMIVGVLIAVILHPIAITLHVIYLIRFFRTHDPEWIDMRHRVQKNRRFREA